MVPRPVGTKILVRTTYIPTGGGNRSLCFLRTHDPTSLDSVGPLPDERQEFCPGLVLFAETAQHGRGDRR